MLATGWELERSFEDPPPCRDAVIDPRRPTESSTAVSLVVVGIRTGEPPWVHFAQRTWYFLL